MSDRHSADASSRDSEWSADSTERTRTALAATSRMKPLFPTAMADLAEDEFWKDVAGLVREQVAAVVAAGEYPFDGFYVEEPTSVDLVAGNVMDAVLDRLPADVATRPGTEPLIAELIRHRLQVSPADRAGRRLINPVGGFDLAAWAWRIRMSPIGKDVDDLLALSDQEIGYFVSRRQEAVVVEMTSRSRQRWLLGNFASEQDALRFVVLRIGADWRSAMGRRQLAGSETAPGMVLEDGPTATHLTWDGGWADFPKGLAGWAGALTFSRVVGMQLEEIAELYQSQNGRRSS